MIAEAAVDAIFGAPKQSLDIRWDFNVVQPALRVLRYLDRGFHYVVIASIPTRYGLNATADAYRLLWTYSGRLDGDAQEGLTNMFVHNHEYHDKELYQVFLRRGAYKAVLKVVWTEEHRYLRQNPVVDTLENLKVMSR